MTQRKPLILPAALALLSFFTIASAQTSVGITPASFDAKVSRGTSYTKTFNLVNNTNTRLRFKCSVADMWYDEANNRMSGRAGTHQRSASLWIQFSPDEIIVEAHSSATVNAVITVPQIARGSYYSVPVFEAMPADPVSPDARPGQVSTAKAAIGLRLNGLILLTTLEGAEYNLEIVGGQITPPTASAELAMQLDVRNTGNAHIRVRGSFAILGASGALAGRGSFEEQRYLPDQRKMLTTGWAGELPPGKYIAIITLIYDRVGLEPATLLYELPLVVQ